MTVRPTRASALAHRRETTALRMRVALLERALHLVTAGARIAPRDLLAIDRHTAHGRASISLFCRTFGIARSAFYAARKRANRPSSPPRAPRTRSPAHVSDDSLIPRIRAIKAEHPQWGVRKVWALLRRERACVVGRKRVWRLMRAEGLLVARVDGTDESSRDGEPKVVRPGLSLATDGALAWTSKDGWVSIVPTIDRGCRSILGLVVAKEQDAGTWLASARDALAKSPNTYRELRTDHGPQFTSRACQRLIADHALTHTFAPRGRPTGNAIVERVIRTMKEELIWTRDFEGVTDLRAALHSWRKTYNDRRPHQSLDYLTPTEYRRLHLASTE